MNFKELVEGKVRLEFGNQEQIKAIDEEIERRRKEEEKEEAAEEKNNRKKLKEFNVRIRVTGCAYVTVEARSEEEAEQMATECWDMDDFEITDSEAEEVEPVRVVKRGEEEESSKGSQQEL